MNRFCSAYFICAVTLAADVSAAGLPDCLRAQSAAGAATPAVCTGDPLRIAEHQTVRNAIEALGLSSVKINFAGCKGSIFETQRHKKQEYTIFYKVVTLRTPADQFNFLLPVMHELGHVLQLELFGGIGKLRKELGPAQIELGADFIAGALYRSRWNAANTSAFDKSMELLGDYGTGNPDDHGRPEDRTAAFQFGFEFPLTGQGRHIHFGPQAAAFSDAHGKFQADLFGQITEFRQ